MQETYISDFLEHGILYKFYLDNDQLQYTGFISRDSSLHSSGTVYYAQGSYIAMACIRGLLWVFNEFAAIPLHNSKIVHEYSNGQEVNRKIKILGPDLSEIQLQYLVEYENVFSEVDPFSEDEFFDFGLFVKNVTESPERQAILISQWCR